MSTSRALFRHCFAAVMVLAAIAARAAAQEGPWNSAADIEFPDIWIGSNPIKFEDLKGKAAVLYFYEESCPKCKGRWPGILATAAQYADKPVAFVAVNSGTPLPLVAQYATSVHLNWPVIVDLDRSFEKACGVGEISLKNIVRTVYVTPEGKIMPGAGKIEDTIERALKGASWNIDPSEVPAELWPTWRSIEFAQYAQAAPSLAKAKSSRKGEVKAAAQKLADLVAKRGAEALAAAKAAAEKSKFRGSEEYAAVADRFAGYAVAAEASAAQRELAKDPAYRQELTAIKQLDKQRRLFASPKPAVRERAAETIKKIIDDHPDSEAARQARELLGETVVPE